MLEQNYTRCPSCATVFRVTSAQLALREGQVRCGQCKAVFDGNAQRVSLAPPRIPDVGAPPTSEAELGPPTVTLRSAQALELPDIASAAPERPAAALAAAVAGAAREAGDIDEVPYEDRFSRQKRKAPRRARAVIYAVAMVFLVALIAAQAVFHFRDAIAAHWPAAQPALTRVCSLVGCTIRPLRDAAMSHLSIDASDLQADPAHRGLLILTATLRNRAAWPLAYPHLELTLTDAQDQIVVRRALAPADYAGGTTDFRTGIPPNGEVAVKVFIDASATSQAGYRLYMFYP
jgi:predicted Zn finger-like uncharacterized protein